MNEMLLRLALHFALVSVIVAFVPSSEITAQDKTVKDLQEIHMGESHGLSMINKWKIDEGVDVQMQCEVVSSDEAHSYEWFYQFDYSTSDGEFVRNSSNRMKEGNKTLYLPSLSRTQSGFYQCMETKSMQYSVLTQLEVQYTNIVLQLGKMIEGNNIMEGDDIYFECLIESFPLDLMWPGSIQSVGWYLNGDILASDPSKRVAITDRTLSLKGVSQKQDGGEYKCSAGIPRYGPAGNIVGIVYSLSNTFNLSVKSERNFTIDTPPTYTVIPPKEQRTECRHPFERVGKGCLLVASSLRLNWNISRQFCQETFDSDLLIFRDEKELLEITQYLAGKIYKGTQLEQRLWVGATYYASNDHIDVVDQTRIERDSLLWEILVSRTPVDTYDKFLCLNFYYIEPGYISVVQCSNQWETFIPVCQYTSFNPF